MQCLIELEKTQTFDLFCWRPGTHLEIKNATCRDIPHKKADGSGAICLVLKQNR